MTVLQKIGIVLAGVMISVVASAQTWVSVPDGVAGQTLPVRISGVAADEVLGAELIRPDESVVRWQQVADETGVAAASVNSMHVRQAGAYQLAVTRGTGEVVTSDFEMMPGAISAFRSTVDAEKLSLAADGEQVSRVLVSVRDAWDNPIAGAPVQVISSRNVDAVVVAPVTDALGHAVAQVRSADAGVSTLSVLADGVEIFSKPELVFFLHGDRGMPAVGADGSIWNAITQTWNRAGELGKAQIFDDEPVGLPAAYFTLEQVNAVETAGKDLTVQVVARDQNGEVVDDFAGTVRFTSSDDRATLPNDYVFTPADQGVHTYYLAVKFGTPGDHTLAVHDLNDFRTSGEMEIEIKSGMAPITVPEEETSVEITFPVNGGASSASRVTIFGEATGCTSITVTDGPIELMAGLEVDSSGSFVYQTPRLADGYHEILATCDDDATVNSGVIRLRVDTSAPQIASVTVSPEGMVEPGQEVQVTVLGTEPLTAAQIVLDGFGTDLMPAEGDEMTFSGALLAPNVAGQYPISVVIVDDLGNRFETPTGGVINVSVAGGVEDEPVVEISPYQVLNLRAQDDEIRKVTLSWDPPQDAAGVMKYRIDYGFEGQELIWQNMTPDGRLRWYVDELDPGVTYDFRVTPIYEQVAMGIESNIASGTPAAPQGVAPTAVTNLQATSGEVEKVPLLWSPAKDDDSIGQYKIEYAVAGVDEVFAVFTPDDRTNFEVRGLEACVKYRFQVTPIDRDGLAGPASELAEATPFCPEEMHESAPATPQSGAADLLVPLFAILAGVGAVILLRKRTA